MGGNDQTSPGVTDKVYYGFGFHAAPPLGGVIVPVNNLALLVPYIGLVATITLGILGTMYLKRHKKSSRSTAKS